MKEMVDGLNDEYRLVVILRYWYDYSYTEIAMMTDTSESAVKSRLFRARQALAKQIDPENIPITGIVMESE